MSQDPEQPSFVAEDSGGRGITDDREMVANAPPIDAVAAMLIDRREALKRVTALLGGAAVAGGPRLLAALARDAAESAGPGAGGAATGQFTAAQIALLDEIAETILPATHTPGAKAAKTGAFRALMVTDCYSPAEQRVFVEGLHHVDEESRKSHGTHFMAATPAERLTLLEALDREQKRVMDAREAEDRRRRGLATHPVDAETQQRQGRFAKPSQPAETTAKAPAHFPDERKEASPEQKGQEAVSDSHRPAHYFRMMKELALLGYFTSEIGCTQAQRYVDTPGRFDACLPYHPGEPAWAGHP